MAGCARPGKPGIYSRVSGGLTWIQGKICESTDTTQSFCTGTGGGGGGGGSTPTDDEAQTDDGADDYYYDDAASTTYEITVKYDKYPKEFGWKLTDASTGAALANYPKGSVTTPGKLLTVTLPLKSGGSYKLIMEDQFGDGLINGYLKVSSVSGGTATVIKNIPGKSIGKKKTVAISV